MSGIAMQGQEDELRLCKESLRSVEDRAVAGMHALELMHDIRDPLETLGHLTYLMARELDNPRRTREYLSQVEEQMDEMRALARESLRAGTPLAERVDLAEIARMALRRHRRRCDAKEVRLIEDLQDGAHAEISAGRILRVVSNLLANAIDALPTGGTVRLRVRKTADEVHVYVTDNGHGMDEEQQQRLFEPFFTTKKDKGTGLGLSLSKRIVEEHQGRIRLRSCVRPGRSGTSFRVSLPA